MLLKSSATCQILPEPTTYHCFHIAQHHSTELSSCLLFLCLNVKVKWEIWKEICWNIVHSSFVFFKVNYYVIQLEDLTGSSVHFLPFEFCATFIIISIWSLLIVYTFSSIVYTWCAHCVLWCAHCVHLWCTVVCTLCACGVHVVCICGVSCCAHCVHVVCICGVSWCAHCVHLVCICGVSWCAHCVCVVCICGVSWCAHCVCMVCHGVHIVCVCCVMVCRRANFWTHLTSLTHPGNDITASFWVWCSFVSLFLGLLCNLAKVIKKKKNFFKFWFNCQFIILHLSPIIFRP